MIDLVASALPDGMVLEAAELARFKREGFLAVLDEETELERVNPALLNELRDEVLATAP